MFVKSVRGRVGWGWWGSEPGLVFGGALVVVVAAELECGDAAGMCFEGLGGLADGDAGLLAAGA